MPASIAQTKPGDDGPVSSLIITFDNTTVSADGTLAIIRAAEAGGGAMPTHAVDGNSGDTPYTSIVSAAFDASARLSAFLFPNIVGRSGHAVTITLGGTAFVQALLIELTGVPTVSLVTGTPAITAAGSASSMASGSVTPLLPGLFIAAGTYGHGSGGPQTMTPSGSWAGTQLIELDEGDAGNGPLGILTKAALAGVADDATWNMNASANGVCALLIAFANAVVGPAPPVYFNNQRTRPAPFRPGLSR